MSIKVNPGMVVRVIEGVCYIVDPAGKILHSLNETGSFIYWKLEKGYETERIIKALCGEFDISPDEAGSDLREFIEVLRGKKILL